MAIRAPDGANKNNLLTLPIGSMDFDNPKVYGDTSISDGLVHIMILFKQQYDSFQKKKQLEQNRMSITKLLLSVSNKSILSLRELFSRTFFSLILFLEEDKQVWEEQGHLEDQKHDAETNKGGLGNEH